ncbi:hypothetical protein AKO1_007784 [Acrasis kona]|uniref:DNA-directed RNA polymerase III subunit RPC4 n=1 Tax=Acrasis kona TaxID=1008807 RepID=A0AAW2YQ23_9EUKA
MPDPPKRQSRYIKKEGTLDSSLAANVAPTGQPRPGSLRGGPSISLGSSTAPSFAPSGFRPSFEPNANKAKQASMFPPTSESTGSTKFRPKPPRQQRKFIKAQRSFSDQPGLLPDDDPLGGFDDNYDDEPVNADSMDVDNKEDILLEPPKPVNPFEGVKNPPIMVPFRADIVDQEKENYLAVEKTQQEMDADALKSQKEMFRMGMDSIIKNDELFFVQLPSSLPIDLDKTKQEQIKKQQAQLYQQMNALKKQNGGVITPAYQAQINELRSKFESAKREFQEIETSKKKISSNVDEDENIWTMPFTNTLTVVPSGYIGEMFVYKSGKIKLKLGDVLLDVSPGTEFSFEEKLVHISTTDKKCHLLGNLKSHLTCTPDIDYLLNCSEGKKK